MAFLFPCMVSYCLSLFQNLYIHKHKAVDKLLAEQIQTNTKDEKVTKHTEHKKETHFKHMK